MLRVFGNLYLSLWRFLRLCLLLLILQLLHSIRVGLGNDRSELFAHLFKSNLLLFSFLSRLDLWLALLNFPHLRALVEQ